MKLILASGSPRRAELLERMGLQFMVQPANTEERLQPGLTPQQQVMQLSRQKAEAAAAQNPRDCVILSADTVVVLDGCILGKPSDEAEAFTMLRALSGRRHMVLTGVTLISAGGIQSFVEETVVEFRQLSDGEIRSYIATGEPMDKAGAYGIQGYAAMFVSGIQGDYYNVMGLPVCTVAQRLKAAGIPILGGTA